MAFWEYAAVMGVIDSKGSTRQYLDRMGAEGWELVTVTPTGYGIYDTVLSRRNEQFGIYYFKRPARPRGLVAASLEIVRDALRWGRQLQRSPAPDRMSDLPEAGGPQ
jgi:hypothetical protein